MRIRIGDVANPASIDHADLGALESDDHLQYHTDARAETWLETPVPYTHLTLPTILLV